MKLLPAVFTLALIAPSVYAQGQRHDHPAPERLGSVTFPTSCAPSVQTQFERAVALLHSFAYSVSEQAFREVSKADPNCAMAHWGIAMTYYHELWEPAVTPANLAQGRAELEQAKNLAKTNREVDASLASSPGRRAALLGAARCAELLGDTNKAQQLRAALGQ